MINYTDMNTQIKVSFKNGLTITLNIKSIFLVLIEFHLMIYSDGVTLIKNNEIWGLNYTI